MLWYAPNGYSGNLRLEATVVESYDIFWEEYIHTYIHT